MGGGTLLKSARIPYRNQTTCASLSGGRRDDACLPYWRALGVRVLCLKSLRDVPARTSGRYRPPVELERLYELGLLKVP